MGTEAQAVPKIQEFKFLVTVDDIPSVYCQTVTPGQRKQHIMKIFGGGMNHPHKEPGQVEYDPLELEYVVPASGQFIGVFEKIATLLQDPEKGYGEVSGYAKQISIQDLDNNNNPVNGWDYYNCLLSVYDPGKRDASSTDKPVIEKVQFEYDYRKRRDIGTV